MATVNRSREVLELRRNYFSDGVREIIKSALNTFEKKCPDIGDYQTSVVFYWRCDRISMVAAEKILLGCDSLPDGFGIMVCTLKDSIH